MHSRSIRSLRAAALLALVAALAACTRAEGAQRDGTVTRYGAPVALGEGTARTYVLTRDGVATEVGIAVTEAAMTGLPAPHSPGAVEMPDGHSMYEHQLPMPADNPTPFRHAMLQWNPGGHEPPGVYDRPHFDFHFYLMTPDERRAIDPADPAFQRKAEHAPDASLIPAGWFLPAPLGIPQMGVHWIARNAPELNGRPFTQTFIYGSWDGKLIFLEPMITKAFLEGKPQFSAPLPAPPAGRQAGVYPTGYRVTWDESAREWRIVLTGLTEVE